MHKNLFHIVLFLICWLWQSLAVQAKSVSLSEGKQAYKVHLKKYKQQDITEHNPIVKPNAAHKEDMGKESVQLDVKENDQAKYILNKQKGKLSSEVKSTSVNLDMTLEEMNNQLKKFEKLLQIEKIQTQLIKEQNNRLHEEIELIQTQKKRDKYTHKKPVYLKNPLRKQDNILVLSDRCIDLNGEIQPWKADYIVEKIAFFNRKNNYYPIFLLIGESPGGSTLSCINILQAIKHSKAPVYVVLKRFAASGAAIIVALAPRSYACTGARFLHHQAAWLYLGRQDVANLDQNYKILFKVWQNIGGAIAKKMGISLEMFNKKILERGGEWIEDSKEAKRLKWVNHIINGLDHTAIYTLPVEEPYKDKYIKDHNIKNYKEENLQSLDQALVYGYGL